MGLQFTPRFIAFEGFGKTIYVTWYGICYAIAFFLIKLIAMRTIRHQKLPISDKQVSILCSFSFLAGIVAARCTSLILNYFQYGQVTGFFQGGLAFQGGLVGGISAGIGYLSFINKVTLAFRILDIFVQFLPLGIFIGRIGNYLNQEFMSQVFDIPMCLFFAINEGILLFLLILVAKLFLRRSGDLTCSFLIFYGVIRLINDSIRDEPIIFNGLKFSEWFCITAIITGLTCLILKQIVFKNKNMTKINEH